MIIDNNYYDLNTYLYTFYALYSIYFDVVGWSAGYDISLLLYYKVWALLQKVFKK